MQNERVEYVISRLAAADFARPEAEAFFRDSRLAMYPAREIAPRVIDWDKVIAQLVARNSVERGVKFLQDHSEILDRAQQDFGVDKEVIVGVIRLESNFGSYSGNYVVFNVFYTSMMRSEEEKRWRWFAENLVALAVYCKTNGYDCFQVQGSYGGAIGPAQFLPKSAELFGADGDGDGIVDLSQPTDALYSAANFLVKHGWHEDKTVALGKYYGSANGYPRAVLAYAEALRKRLGLAPPPPDPEKSSRDSRVILRTN
ncbi:MAG: lytic murein transglycosylase [Acidobacteria bacterium]|nr:lytic murein transglycosylase [Acidobacteriota bacterium]